MLPGATFKNYPLSDLPGLRAERAGGKYCLPGTGSIACNLKHHLGCSRGLMLVNRVCLVLDVVLWGSGMAKPEGVRRGCDSHAVVVPLFGEMPPDLPGYLMKLANFGLEPVIVDNRVDSNLREGSSLLASWINLSNLNKGGIAGALNRGVEAALASGVHWITLLDQDSRIAPEAISRLLDPLRSCPSERLVVGPTIWDAQRKRVHDKARGGAKMVMSTRLLISSGITFHASQWHGLGPFHEGLFIDYVDHYWCFRAQQRGYQLLKHGGVMLCQYFGDPHPNIFCRWLGMQLYSPARHFYALRNLRWLVLRRCIPADLKIKELLKMMFKPWFWLLFEPDRGRNLIAILRGLTQAIPPETT